MANFTAYSRFDYRFFGLFSDYFDEESSASISGSTKVTINDGYTTAIISGTNLQSTQNGLTGVMTSFSLSTFGDNYLSISESNYNLNNTVYDNGFLISGKTFYGDLAELAYIMNGNDTINGSSQSDRIAGFNGNDVINGNGGNDYLEGWSGNDNIKGGLGKDFIDGGAEVDTADYSDKTTAVKVTLNKSTNATVYVNGVAEDTIKNIENITGGSGADTITGDAYANTLNGNSGNDNLNGGAGSDTLIGGAGTDKLYGGSDTVRDVFDFNSITESKVGTARDKVYNFVKGIDDLDLKTIDANTKVSGDQAFLFNNTTAKANSLWYAVKDVDGSTATKDIIVYGDVNGDAKADFEIGLVGVTSLTSADFVL